MNRIRIAKAFAVSLSVCALLAATTVVEARAIRVDDDDGGGVWTFPVGSSADSLFVSDIGFEFNFFGTRTSSLTINSNGSVTFGDAIIAPFLDETATTSYSYSTTNSGQEPTPGIPSAFRAQWGGDSGDNQFQLALFDLNNGSFAMEFNYGQITKGSDATSSIFFNNGAAIATDLLADLGLTFDEYKGIGADAEDPDNETCDSPAKILACNNYFSETGVFGPSATVLPPSFGGFFRLDPTFGVPAQGRYLFLIENEVTEVPEPPTTELLLTGLFAAALMLRHRRRGELELVQGTSQG